MYQRLMIVAVALLTLTGCPDDNSNNNQPAEPTWHVVRTDNRPCITPVATVVADMDGDGFLDIVSAWRGSNDTDPVTLGLIAIHLNNDTDPWQTLVVEQSERYNSVNAITVGDINQDDHPDIVVAAQDRIIYLRAPENLRKVPGVAGTTTWEAFDLEASIDDAFVAWYDVAIGQIDSKYGPDIAATLADDGRLVWFKAPEKPDTAADWTLKTIDATTRAQCDSLILADLNGDAKLDVISSAPGETKNVISWYEHPADVDADPWTKRPMSDFVGATRIALGDLNSDGKPDLAAISPTDQRAAWLIQPTLVTSRWGGYVMADFSLGFDKRTPIDIAITDVKLDGTNDIVIATNTNTVVSWYTPGSNNTYKWIEHEIARLTDYHIGLIGLGDINADTYTDIAVPEDSTTNNINDGIYWYRNPYFNTQPAS